MKSITILKFANRAGQTMTFVMKTKDGVENEARKELSGDGWSLALSQTILTDDYQICLDLL